MTKLLLRCLFRPTLEPSLNLPLGTRSVGHYLVPPGYRDNVAVKEFVQIFWGIAGAGALVINDQEHRIGPSQIGVYFPGMRHVVYALNKEWEYCWWTMDGPLAVSVVMAFGLTADVYDSGPAPVQLFRSLENAVRDPSQAAERQASALAYHLLTLAVAGRWAGVADHLVNEAVRVIHAEWNQVSLCIDQLADRLHIHRSSLTRRFVRAVGIPPITYILRLRMQNALLMLRQADKTIAEVSRLCGYSDPNYFARLVRKHAGLSPRRFQDAHTPEPDLSKNPGVSHK